jgi:NRPS condensation-like uncharacterized protein
MSQAARGFAFNECDAFMWAMDRGMRRVGSNGNICHLLITLAQGAPLHELAQALSALPVLRYLQQLVARRTFTGALRWEVLHVRRESPCALWQLSTRRELEEAIVRHRLQPRRDPPFGFVLLPQYEGGPALLFYWHHALCDARGGEQLVQLLAQGCQDEVVLPRVIAPESVRETVRRARSINQHIFRQAAPPITKIPSSRSDAARQRYAKIRFSAVETERIDALSRALTGGIFPMALYLAATARGVAAIAPGPLFIPVPQDMRRTTREKSPLSNQVSFVFFRIDARADETLADTTNGVIAQLHQAIAEQHPQGMRAFLRLIARLPAWLGWRVIEQPLKGHPASVYFSHIGVSLGELTTFHGVPVQDATHYPPHLAPPGFTAVWARYRHELEVTVCYDEQALAAGACDLFRHQLYTDLVQGGVGNLLNS